MGNDDKTTPHVGDNRLLDMASNEGVKALA